jgi:hypothetical protein
MKKHLLLLGAFALTMAVSSCKKENSDLAVKATSEAGKLKVNTLPQPTYYDLELIPRQPGENYDTYYANFHGSNVYIVGPPIYDQAKYPTLVNGVPCFGQSMYSTNEGVIEYQNTGADGNVFEVSQGHMLYTDYSKVNSDLDSYFKAEDAFQKFHNAGAQEPSIFSYVSNNYKSTSTSLDLYLFVGKVIRVTTGTHWALAEINYPLPPPSSTTNTSTKFLDGVPDPITGYIYHIWGFNGLVNKVPDAISVAGTYTPTTNPFVFNVNITIVRKDGTSFNYVGPTIDLS